MDERLEALVSSLLYEGYALYPYTPGATKNATPTPFGIVYPPVYAAECDGAFDHARLECVADAEADARLTATLCYLAPSGERHQADERRVELSSVAAGERRSVGFDGGRFTLRSEWLADGGLLVRACVHNTAGVEPGLDRAAALARSLISTHIVVEISAGRFVSPLEAGRANVNIWPVLAGTADDAVLGAAIVLPGPSPDLAREPRQPVRQHRDRGGAGPARPRADGLRARAGGGSGPCRGRDARAGAGRHAGGDRRPAQRPATSSRPISPAPVAPTMSPASRRRPSTASRSPAGRS